MATGPLRLILPEIRKFIDAKASFYDRFDTKIDSCRPKGRGFKNRQKYLASNSWVGIREAGLEFRQQHSFHGIAGLTMTRGDVLSSLDPNSSPVPSL